MFAELDAHNSRPAMPTQQIPREPGARHSALNPRDPCRSMLEMPQGDGDETYPHPLPRNSGEWRHLSRNIGREAFCDYATMTAAGLAFYK